MISDKDVGDVTKALGSLSAGDYKKEMEQMDKEGLLGKYVGEMSPKAREEFLEQAAQKGYIQKGPGEKPGTKTLNPPAAPSMFVNDPKLPKALREAVHEQNVGATKRYGEDYDKSMKRYSEAVKAAPNALAIQKLGKPAEPASFREPGMMVCRRDYQRMSTDWNNRTPTLVT